MTPEGDDLYATADDGILQFDVAADGRLTLKSPALEPVAGPAPAGDGHKPDVPYAIAVHPDGDSVYVSDRLRGQMLQYNVGAGGRLVPKDPASVAAGRFPSGVAGGRTAAPRTRSSKGG
jgi:hypothetical protein